MTKIRKYAVIFLAILMALAAAPMAMAAGDVAAPDWLKDAFEKGGNLTLSEDVSFDKASELVLSTDKTLNLDLNGHKIEWTANGGKLEARARFAIVVEEGATLNISDSGTDGAIKALKGTFVKVNDGARGIANYGTVNIKSGIIESEYAAMYLYANSKDSVSAVMDGGKLQGRYGVVLFAKKASFTINAGTIKATPASIEGGAISGNGSDGYGDTVITINGGTIDGGKGIGIYHPQSGKLYINGGEISGCDGVQVKAGSLEMTGGKITASGVAAEPPYESDSTETATGTALSLLSQGAPSSNYAGNITAKISGGAVLESKNNYAVVEAFVKGSTDVNFKSLSIEGGTFTGGTAALSIVHTDGVTLTGGSYSSDPSDYVDKTSCTIVEKDGLFTVKGKAAPIVTPVKPALPDGTSDDVTAEIKPATAVVLGVDTTKSAITEETKAAAITDTMKVISADITSKDLTVNEETGAVEISVATASEAAKGLLKDNETLASKDIAPLPVFTADVEIGKTAMVSYKLTGSALKAKTAEEVRVMKILSSTTAGEFEYASEITADMDGKFTIQKADDGKTIYSGALEAGTEYLLTLFIKDGNSFDLDGAENGSITDPAAIFSTTTTEPQHGSSSSGCNGGFGALALLGLALVPVFYGKKR
ncbi:Synerg-CTERM sorting domain-containing protein [Cloacibacillus evryensis]|nr:Synerg-CTERM sorting domain-containing protein [Cloacibacillus evryensis]EHL63660.1 hypothetical protein HMPREF1006_01218 [Synergistes sp. 3_1_syn1]